ncbi:TlpA family protein disulfide reductase [Pinibacter aurantiacus]|uniref:TlpA family protein disulfide reductase n=1 Tax=Pinibacter aurantiacus TaxID=2851599 RepID=A0A9E2W3M8_9BACT|nr:TlpA disulfide reductase family protein [Pinibacter aurantiacus]MBV4358725.1 TlpA family protein disulfide reductase [Pinibacter aurantiacus]
MEYLKRTALAVALFTSVFVLGPTDGTAQFNSNVTLKIGDAAPALKVEGWAKGRPLTGFKKSNVYVIDFWATWCGGCIASFPQISAIEEKYKGKVQFASIDSYEDIGDNKGKDAVTIVKEFLKTPKGQTLKLNVAVDGKANSMYNSWIKPLRRQGFPTTFIIDGEGKIAWVDVNLDQLDWALEQVLAGTWDKQKAAQIMKGKDDLEDQLIKGFQDTANKKSIMRAMKSHTEQLEKQFPDRRDAFAFYKLFALLEVDMSGVPAVLEQMAADPLSRYLNLSDAVGLTLQKPNLSKETYMACAKIQERLLQYQFKEKGYGGKSVKAYQELADTYYHAGNYKLALSNIQEAIQLAQKEKVSAEKIEELQKMYGKYQQKG